MKTSSAILLAGIILLSACKSKDSLEPEMPPPATKSSSFKVGGSTCNVNISSMSRIFSNDTLANSNNLLSVTIHNNLKLTATDGSIVEFNFVGDAPATYSLVSDSNAYFKNPVGKQYNATSGQLIISEVTSNKMSGTFSFWAKTTTSPYDSLQITEGIIVVTVPVK